MDQPASKQFYVVTNGISPGIWRAYEEELTELLQTHPGYSVVQSYSSHQEAEAHIQTLRNKEL